MSFHQSLRLALIVVAEGTRSLGAQDTLSHPGARRDSVRSHQLEAVKVTGRIDDLVGVAASASEGHVGAAELRLRPITREGEQIIPSGNS